MVFALKSNTQAVNVSLPIPTVDQPHCSPGAVAAGGGADGGAAAGAGAGAEGAAAAAGDGGAWPTGPRPPRGCHRRTS